MVNLFDVRISLIVGVIYTAVQTLCSSHFDDSDVVFVVVVDIEIGDVEVAIVEYHQYGVTFIELSQESTVPHN